MGGVGIQGVLHRWAPEEVLVEADETKTETGTTGGLGYVDRQLDWVAVLGREHAEEVFRRLHEVVQRDVESARKHARAGGHRRFLGFGQVEICCSDIFGEERRGFEVECRPAEYRSPQLRVCRAFELESRGTQDWRPGGIWG